jgi:hypothetical protein
MRKPIDYLKERLEKTLEEVTFLKEKIRIEEKKDRKYTVKVIVETEVEKDFWRSTTLAELDLTIEERERVIANLAWLRKAKKEERKEKW